eukprot:jgi/Hompol1/5971/HPOL_000172-RA
MGLSEPKNKQRISVDPQNIQWKEDKSKFGFKMLEKMGWSEGKGLGRQEDGVKDSIAVRFKADNRGIGSDKRSSDNWLENSSAFDALLSSLATSGEPESVPAETKPAAPQFGRLL